MATGPAVSIALTGMQFLGAPAALFGPVALEVAPGEVVALIGPSGVGKTSLLRMIGGLERDFRGGSRLEGCPPIGRRHRGSCFRMRDCCRGWTPAPI